MGAVVAVGGIGVNVAVFSGTAVFVFVAFGGCLVNVAVDVFVFVGFFVAVLLGVTVGVIVTVDVCSVLPVLFGVIVRVAVLEGVTVGDNEGEGVNFCVPTAPCSCSRVAEFVISGF